MSTKCPSCGSTDINFETRTCRNCGDSIDATPLPEEGALMLIQEASDAMEDATTEEEQRAAYNTWEERVFDFHDQGFRIITLIGFSGAGKTFLANRLRFELTDDWKVLPAHADVIEGTGLTIELTQLVSKEAEPRRICIADCDGEAFRVVGEAALQNRDIDWKMRRSIVITALASAYILVLPAAELIDPRSFRLTNFVVQRFGTIVQLIMALQRIARSAGGAREALQQGLRLDAVGEALQHEFRCEQPIHVLFAQADKLPKGQRHEDDPHLFALTYAKTLYRAIESNFTNFRFDFACAFEGHNANDAFEVDYNLPSYGTVAAFNWIDGMLAASPRDRRETATAMKIRRLFDPTFRKMSARVSG